MNRSRLNSLFPKWADSNSELYQADNKEASLEKVNAMLAKFPANEAPNKNAWFAEKKAVIEAL